MSNLIKIDLGCGRRPASGYIGIDVTQYTDGRGKMVVDIVRDVGKHGLPFSDNSAEEIRAADSLDHFSPKEIVFVMNECWRVLTPTGHLVGSVGLAGTPTFYKDPTHFVRFVPETFNYFCGVSDHMDGRPKYPRYADYGILPWVKEEVRVEGETIHFKLTPNKI
jgi:SAM-dependent methyltransferase